jgi:hypothetical protein
MTRPSGSSIFQDPLQGSVLEVLDALLDKGVVLHGEIVLTVAGVDLVFIGLHAVIASTETMIRSRDVAITKAARP